MIRGLDSSFDRPTPDEAAQAFAAGVRVWGGYLPPGANLLSPWDRASFEVVQRAGMRAIGFCSGWDDPVQLRQLAAEWGVLGCLDDEPGIRTGSGWQQAWLDASGFGVYGLCSAVMSVRAPFRIVARYPGFDPRAPWDTTCSPGPPEPHGWQWQGTHTELGLSVDSLWLEDWFGGDMTLDPTDPVVESIEGKLDDLVVRVRAIFGDGLSEWPLGVHLAGLTGPVVSVPELASALIADPTFIPAIARAVVQLEGSKLSS